MKAERKEREIIVNLSAEEVFRIQDEKTVGDRPSVTMPDAKIDVLPLSMIKKDTLSEEERYASDRLEKGLAAKLEGNIYPNGDLEIFIPKIKIADVRITKARLPRESIKTPLSNKKNRKALLESAIPPDGVKIKFGGSLKVVDLSKYFYRDED